MKLAKPSREQLIKTAALLFYERGVSNVGINEITRKAGVARMTLYNNFADKEELILASLEFQAERRRTMITTAVNRKFSPEERLIRFFAIAEELAKKPNFRGCAFINSALQTADPTGPVHALAKRHKQWIQSTIAIEILEQIQADRVELISYQILLLWDGAVTDAYIRQSGLPIKAAISASKKLAGFIHQEK